MKIVELKRMKADFEDMLQRSEVVDGISFLDDTKQKDVLDAFTSVEELNTAFNIIGVKYVEIKITEYNSIVYEVEDGSKLSLSNLSSGERYLLYLLACKRLNKIIIAKGLFERIGKRLEDVVYDELSGYDGLTVINCNRSLPKRFAQFVIN